MKKIILIGIMVLMFSMISCQEEIPKIILEPDELYNNTNSSILANKNFTYHDESLYYDTGRINCSDIYNNTPNTRFEAWNVVGCVFSEFNQENPELTMKILDKYHVEVMWDEFVIPKNKEEK